MVGAVQYVLQCGMCTINFVKPFDLCGRRKIKSILLVKYIFGTQFHFHVFSTFNDLIHYNLGYEEFSQNYLKIQVSNKKLIFPKRWVLFTKFIMGLT